MRQPWASAKVSYAYVKLFPMIRAASLSATASFITFSAFAEPQEATKFFVSSDSQKTWTVTAFIMNLGGEACKEGEEYTFRASGSVTHSVCDGANTTETTYNWSFRSDGIDEFLFFNGTEYRLTAWTEISEDLGIEVENLSLRIEDEKPDLTANIEMQHVQ